MTQHFYDENGSEYFQQTHALNMDHLYEPFLQLIRPNGKILDAGCGSGRDTKRFRQLGFEVTAIEASITMARLASTYSGQVVNLTKFEDLQYEEEFDGVWACASLVHVPLSSINVVMKRMWSALKCDGYWFMSFKSGYGERVASDGRLYLDFDKDNLEHYLKSIQHLTLVQLWSTQDVRESQHTPWVNAIVRKTCS